MSKAEPMVQKIMTHIPESIDVNANVKEAQEKMSRLQIRHLPVLKNGKVFGIVTDRDIKLAMGLVQLEPALLKVSDVCHEQPYSVDPDTPIGQVAATMAEEKYGSALVVQNGKLVGIITTVDICRALWWVLETRCHH